MRTETDSLGTIQLDDAWPFGIHTKRAERNFAFTPERIRPELFFAVISVKRACARANADAGLLDTTRADAVIAACDIVREDISSFVPPVHPLQGGAGTSVNMAANELLANIALRETRRSFGDYEYIHPLGHVNLSQSTNDVFMTAVRIAIIGRLRKLHDATEEFLSALLEKEKEFAPLLKVGRTELQDAMPVSLGQEFGAWADAAARFRWRLSKAVDWIREVNIGGTAVGTSINADPAYVSAVVEELRNDIREPLSLSRNLVDGTQNADQLVEVSGLVRTGAVAVKKIASDLRLLSSGPRTGFGEIVLPALQAGSSIMPGKVNPVLPEAAEQVCLEIMGGDHIVAHAVSQGNLELQQFLPLIAHHMTGDTALFSGMLRAFTKTIRGIAARRDVLERNVATSFAVATLLAPAVGHDTAADIVRLSAETDRSIVDIVRERGLLSDEMLGILLSPNVMASPGPPLRPDDDVTGKEAGE